MPSGFTAPLYEGKPMTFEEFVWRCAHGMSALIALRDQGLDAPVPERFEPSPYYAERAAKAEAEYRALEAMTDEEAEAAAAQEYEERLANARRYADDNAALRGRYRSMLAKVADWQPPTPEHEGLKKLMHDQLTDSLKFDCGEMPMPERLSGAQWRAKALPWRKRAWERAQEDMQKEIERTEERNRWLAVLRESVPMPAEVRS